MIAILLAAAAAVGSPPPQMPAPGPGTARSVMESQLAVPPRTSANAGLGANEADEILKRYLASIGQRLDPISEGSPQ